MKKLKFLLPLLVILVITGCGKSPEDVLKGAIDKTNEADSYHLDMNANIELGFDGSSISMAAKGSYDCITDEVCYMEATTSFFGVSNTEKSYVVLEENKQTTYSQLEDNWYKQEEEIQTNLDIDIFKNVQSIEKLKDEEYTTYKITLSEEQIKQIMSSTSELTEDADVSSIDISNVETTVTIKDGYFYKMKLSMPMSVDVEEQTMTASVVLDVEFSKFNEVEVTIPDEIINSAIDMKEYEIKEYADDYIFEVEWELIGSDGQNQTYTDTSLDYDGPQPTKVELKIVDGDVTDGIIELDGYRVTVVDGSATEITKM